MRAEAPAEALDPTKLPPPLPGHGKKAGGTSGNPRRTVMIFGFVFLLLAGGGGGAYFYFMKPDAAQDAVKGMRDKLEQAAQLPGKAVDDAKQAIAGAREKEQARIDSVPEGKETPADRAIGAAPADVDALLKEKNATTPAGEAAPATPPRPVEQVTAYAGERADASAPPPPPAANPRFVRYAEALRVSGVFQGNPARALVDGRLVRSGDLIEPVLGVTFVGVDAETKHLLLQDTTGAQVRVKY